MSKPRPATANKYPAYMARVLLARTDDEHREHLPRNRAEQAAYALTVLTPEAGPRQVIDWLNDHGAAIGVSGEANMRHHVSKWKKANGHDAYQVDSKHTVALAQCSKHQERVAYACKHLPRADLHTANVEAWLLVHGWKVPRPKVSQYLNKWRRENDAAVAVSDQALTRETVRRILNALIAVADEHHEEFIAHLTDPAESIGETQ